MHAQDNAGKLAEFIMRFLSFLREQGISCDIQIKKLPTIIIQGSPIVIELGPDKEAHFMVTHKYPLLEGQRAIAFEALNRFNYEALFEKGMRCYYDDKTESFVYESYKCYPTFDDSSLSLLYAHLKPLQEVYDALQPYVEHLVANNVHCEKDYDFIVSNVYDIIQHVSIGKDFYYDRLRCNNVIFGAAIQLANPKNDAIFSQRGFEYIPGTPLGTEVIKTNLGVATFSLRSDRKYICASMKLKFDDNPSDLAAVYRYINFLNARNADAVLYPNIFYSYQIDYDEYQMDFHEFVGNKPCVKAEIFRLPQAKNETVFNSYPITLMFMQVFDLERLEKIVSFFESL